MQRPDREEWLAASFSFARATMLGTAALCWIAALGADPRYLKSNALGVTVNAIAFVHYNQMQADFVRGKGVWATRFSDWAATVPLMVLEVYALLGSTLLRALPAAGLSLLMIVLGALSQVHPERGGVLVTLSFGALCGVYALVVTEGLDAAVSASTVAVSEVAVSEVVVSEVTVLKSGGFGSDGFKKRWFQEWRFQKWQFQAWW